MKTICILLLSMIGCAPIAGCRCIWTDDLFMIGLFTDITTENSQLISDPNGLKIQTGSYNSSTDDIDLQVTHPSGIGVGLKAD